MEYQLRGTGLFAGSTATAHALARSQSSSANPGMKLQLHKISSGDRNAEAAGMALDPHGGSSIGFFQLYPDSRGSVHAISADPLQAPQIVTNYLTAQTDREVAVRGIRLARRIAGQPALHPFMVEETRPALDDDDGLLDYARANGQTSYHPVGICRMGTDVVAVVDLQCWVRGVNGLRVADASIMPFIVSPNTNAPAIAIGERAAKIVLDQANR